MNKVPNQNIQKKEKVEPANKDGEVHSIHSTTIMLDPGEPKNNKATRQGKKKEEWTQAIKLEIKNSYKQEVWKRFPRNKLDGRKPLGSQWVFK